MIEVKNVYKRFGSLEVLRGINLEVKHKEIVAIVGKSGAGKSTLLQIIGSLDQPDSGSVVIDGVDLSQMNEKKLAHFRNHHIGFIFQFHQLLPEFTALENVMMPALIAGENRNQTEQKAAQLLERLGLEDRLNHKPQQLSGGEKQRVAAARAMIMNPSIILADEPTGSLDEKNKQELCDLLQKMHQEMGQTILLVTHDKDMTHWCDRILEIQDGKMV